MADDPEITPDAGTGTDDTEPETTDEAEVTDTPADDSADGDDATDGDDSGHQAAAGTNVPYSRFKSVNDKRKAAEAKSAELEAKLAALSPKAEPVAPKDRLKRALKPAPEGSTPLEAMEHYALETLETHPEIFDQWFESKFGMPADQAAATLAHTTTTTREAIRSQFDAACGERGIDPKNPAVQDAVGRMMDSKKYRSFGEALDVFVKPKATTTTVTKKSTPKGPESSGVDVDGLSRVRILPKSAREASELAAKGQRVEHMSVSDILRATMGT